METIVNIRGTMPAMICGDKEFIGKFIGDNVMPLEAFETSTSELFEKIDEPDNKRAVVRFGYSLNGENIAAFKGEFAHSDSQILMTLADWNTPGVYALFIFLDNHICDLFETMLKRFRIQDIPPVYFIENYKGVNPTVTPYSNKTKKEVLDICRINYSLESEKAVFDTSVIATTNVNTFGRISFIRETEDGKFDVLVFISKSSKKADNKKLLSLFGFDTKILD